MNTKWTWSAPREKADGKVSKKMPVNMADLRYDQKITGCPWGTDEPEITVSLPTLIALFPNVPNHAYHLDYETDGFVCLDIEPSCPDDLKQKLLQTPYIYGEYSMSGKGFHLFFRTPDLIKDYPAAAVKTELKDDNRYFEILLNHWVTFTRNMIQPSAGTESFDDIFETMCKAAEVIKRQEFDITKNQPEIPRWEMIKAFMQHTLDRYRKTPADFNGDVSSYEFGYAAYLYNKIDSLLESPIFRESRLTYDSNQRMWMVYLLIKDNLPYRDKHETFRDDIPLLLYTAKNVVARFDPEKSGQKPNSKSTTSQTSSQTSQKGSPSP